MDSTDDNLICTLIYNWVKHHYEVYCGGKAYEKMSDVPRLTWTRPYVDLGVPVVAAPPPEKRVKPRFA
jgi:hypothetical protein